MSDHDFVAQAATVRDTRLDPMAEVKLTLGRARGFAEAAFAFDNFTDDPKELRLLLGCSERLLTAALEIVRQSQMKLAVAEPLPKLGALLIAARQARNLKVEGAAA